MSAYNKPEGLSISACDLPRLCLGVGQTTQNEPSAAQQALCID